MGSVIARIFYDPTVQDAGALPTARSWWVWEHYVGPPYAADQNQEFYIPSNFGADTGWSIRGKFENANPPTYYTIRLYHDAVMLAEGSTHLDTSRYYAGRFTWLSGQAAVEIGGIYEINVAHANPIPSDIQFCMGGGGVGTTVLLLRNFLPVRGDGSADRPSWVPGNRIMTAIESATPPPAPTYTAWTGDETDIEDWDGGGATNDANYITPGGTSPVKESFTAASVPTIGAGQTALWLHSRHELTGAPAGAKQIGDPLIYDGTDERTLDLGTLAAAQIVNRSALFTKAPDNAAWDQDALDNLEFGMSGADFDASIKIRCIAQAGEFLEYALDAGDPPALAVPHSRGTVI